MPMPGRTSTHSATVFVVDPDAAQREAVCRVAHTMNLRCQTFVAREDFLRSFDDDAPGCLVLEVGIPDINGLTLYRRLVGRGGSLPVIFLTDVPNVAIAVEALREGAFHWLQKPVPARQLWDAIEQAVAFDRHCRQQRQQQAEIERRLDSLSHRERLVLMRMGRGMPVCEIADELKVTTRTVQTCRGRLLKKLKICGPMEVYRYALAAEARRPPPAPES